VVQPHPAGASPYRLYALSNAGSLLALVSYPFFFETHLTRKAQAGCGLGVRGLRPVLRLLCRETLEAAVGSEEDDLPATEDLFLNSQPSTINLCLWLLLPACASVLLLATTNKLCQDVAVIPFLWVLPLGLYLLSFILCFDSPRWYRRFPFTLALIAALGGICWALDHADDLSLRQQVAIYGGGLFICCMVCHGELYRLKPDPRYLTSYYLMIAAAGPGGLFVAVAAPLVFTDYYELHWGFS